jgi:hypothetical protein
MSTPVAAVKARSDETAMFDTAGRFRPPRVDFTDFKPRHFLWQLDGKVATVTLNRPERKNPLTLESYASCGTPSVTSSTPTASRAW